MTDMLEKLIRLDDNRNNVRVSKATNIIQDEINRK